MFTSSCTPPTWPEPARCTRTFAAGGRSAITVSSGSYLALELGAGLGGGIVECPVRRPLWLPYVEVEEVHRATEHARERGAAVLLEPREGPAGWRSVIATDAGGELAFWQQKS